MRAMGSLFISWPLERDTVVFLDHSDLTLEFSNNLHEGLLSLSLTKYVFSDLDLVTYQGLSK